MIQALILWGHALTALVFGAVALGDVRRPGAGTPRRLFVVGLGATALWALAIAGIEPQGVGALVMHGVRDIAWLGFMFALVRRDRAGGYALGAVYGVVALVAVAGIGVAVLGDLPAAAPAREAAREVSVLLRLMTVLSALLLLHHLLSGVARAERGGVRLVVIGLVAMWGIDCAVLGARFFGAGGVEWLIAARGFLLIVVALLLSAGAQRDGAWTLGLSRTVAMRSLLAGAVALYATMTVLLTSLAASWGGGHVRIVQTGIVFFATTVLVTLLSTSWLRAWVTVKVAKHLFRHRYDYRVEWQRFTATLAQGDAAGDPLARRLVRAVADLTLSPAGLLLVAEDAGLSVATGWNWQEEASAGGELLARHLGETQRIVALDAVRAGTAPAAEIAGVPGWMLAVPDAWAIVPLIHAEAVIGAILLARPPVDRVLDWEDLDLLRVAGRQAASYLAEDRAHAALADAARFDEFNRRFAFIMHDIKNLVSQITLVARNAERHADNPDFRADMVATLNDSAGRMNALLARLSQHHGGRIEPLQPVDIGALADRAAAARRAQHPIERAGGGALAIGQPARLEQVIAHLLQNAIEASAPDAPVTITVEGGAATVAIVVTDRGCGMTAGFVREQLFRPFVSTKPEGFGIGAFEARQLVTGMGGTMTVTSREGEGTCFRILLPVTTSLEVAA